MKRSILTTAILAAGLIAGCTYTNAPIESAPVNVENESPSVGTQIGQQAPEFSLTKVSGEAVSRESLTTFHADLDSFLGECEFLSLNCASTAETRGPKGDLLFRWGNPETYSDDPSPTFNRADKKSFWQHDVQWRRPVR